MQVHFYCSLFRGHLFFCSKRVLLHWLSHCWSPCNLVELAGGFEMSMYILNPVVYNIYLWLKGFFNQFDLTVCFACFWHSPCLHLENSRSIWIQTNIIKKTFKSNWFEKFRNKNNFYAPCSVTMHCISQCVLLRLSSVCWEERTKLTQILAIIWSLN